MDVFCIPLCNGGEAIIDKSDLSLVQQWGAWYLDSRGYAAAHKPGDNQKTARLHRLILGFPETGIDHRNRNKLDCRRENLRQCNDSQNQANRDPLPHSCDFKGVTLQKKTGKWECQIWNKRQRHYLGTFDNAVIAARAYDRKALELFGDFARTNFPREEYAST